MSTSGVPSIVYEASPATIALTTSRRRSPALAGEPVKSFEVLHSDAGGRSGVWECTPGCFESARTGDTELMHFIAGIGTITTADGSVHDIRPGVALVAPDGWRGTWDIRETVRKVYTIWTAATPTPKTGETS